jgi:hypothetical protein
VRTTTAILTDLTERIKSMLKRPFAYSDSPIALEAMVLVLIGIYTSILADETQDRNITKAWRAYTYDKIKNHTALTTAGFLRANDNLDENWTQLTDLLRGFFFGDVG